MSESSLRIVARLRARKGKGEDLEGLLRGLIVPTRCERGCIKYELLRNIEDPDEFTFVEEWKDEKSLGAHFETDHIKHALERFPDLLAEDLDLKKYRTIT